MTTNSIAANFKNFTNSNISPVVMNKHNVTTHNTDVEKSNAAQIMLGATALAGTIALGIYLAKSGKIKGLFKNGKNIPTPQTPSKPLPTNTPPAVPRPTSTPAFKTKNISEKATENLKKKLSFSDEVTLVNGNCGHTCYKNGKPFTGKLIDGNKIQRYKQGKLYTIFHLDKDNSITAIIKQNPTVANSNELLASPKTKTLSTAIKLNEKLLERTPLKEVRYCDKNFSKATYLGKLTKEVTLKNGNIVRTIKTPSGKYIITFDKNENIQRVINYSKDEFSMGMLAICKSVRDRSGAYSTNILLYPDKFGKWKTLSKETIRNGEVVQRFGLAATDIKGMDKIIADNGFTGDYSELKRIPSLGKGLYQ